MNCAQKIVYYQTRVNAALAAYLPDVEQVPQRLHQAMHYAVLNGGKRIRPLLVYATGEALNITPELLDPIACSIELIHAYSLIHDDLPAMDDDALRRGQPTCHIAFDEATAILAGDALQSLAFSVLANIKPTLIAPTQILQMLSILAKATGAAGMAGGQAIDLAATGQQISLAELENMHSLKTGALIQACVQLAALAAAQRADKTSVSLQTYAQCVGLAFQIQDDILDVETTTVILGKQQGADISRHKATYPQLIGLQNAKEQANALLAKAIDSVAMFGDQAALLVFLAEFMVHRKY